METYPKIGILTAPRECGVSEWSACVSCTQVVYNACVGKDNSQALPRRADMLSLITTYRGGWGGNEETEAGERQTDDQRKPTVLMHAKKRVCMST